MLKTGDSVILCILIPLCILLLALLRYIVNQKNKKQLQKIFAVLFFLILLWLFPMIFQILFMDKYHIEIKYFYYIYYIGICFLPVAFFFMAMIFVGGKIKLRKTHYLLFVIPILSLILLWTNDFHHLFYKEYSTSLSTEYGPYFFVHTIYTFALFIVSLLILLKYSVKNSGFFSQQAILILLGTVAPLIVNLLGITQLFSISIYATPIAFAFTIICITIAIFKFDFIKIAPIALQRIVDRISDSYIVLNDDMIITDFNQTLLKTFSLPGNIIRNMNIIDLISNYHNMYIDIDIIIQAVNKTRLEDKTITIEQHFKAIDKYFHIEINSIKNNNTYLGTLILLKDITQHTKDMQTIKENQEVLVEKERLASLGQMIGGIAHNLKTPIMSISGAAEGLSDLTNEYRNSIGDPDITIEDHHAIAHDMDEWISKIRTHLSYMSDIITAVKGQAVAFSDNMVNGFTVDELVKHVDILMKHELKNALITLNTNIELDKDTKVGGNINSLVQVINNIISNAIQAYNGKQNENINFNLSKKRKILGNCHRRFCWWITSNSPRENV